jgi:hypothetical protein
MELVANEPRLLCWVKLGVGELLGATMTCGILSSARSKLALDLGHLDSFRIEVLHLHQL